MKLSVKKGDNVLVIAGKDAGKTGEVLEVNKENGKVVVSSTSKPVVDTSVDYTMAVTFVGVILTLCVMAAVVLGKKARFEK
jgi:ribosomal protein L24